MKKLYLAIITTGLMQIAHAQYLPLDATTTTPSVIYQDANSLLGIGTATPAALLHLNVNSLNYSTVPDYLTITEETVSGVFPGINTATTTKLIVKADGKVGIGTAEPMGMLQVVSTEGFDMNKDFMGGNVWVATHNNEGFIGGLFDLSDEDEEAGLLVIQSHSNVPISGTSPTQYDVIPAFGVMNKMEQMINFAVGGDGTVAMGIDLTQNGLFENAAQFNLRSDNNHTLLMNVESVAGSTQHLTVHNNGSVGIGIANAGDAKLEITATPANTSRYLWVNGGSNNTRLVVRNDGVGIGIDDFSTLNSTLAVKGKNYSFVDLYEDSTHIAGMRWVNSAGAVRHIIRDDNDLVIDPGYNNNANDLLKVLGSLEVTGDFTVGGNFHYTNKVLIGNVTAPANSCYDYMLYVEKGILTEKVKVAVKTTADWCDYVFDKNYPLRPLNDLEQYIHTNKHLPEIPGTQEVMTSGLDLGAMDAKLLKKVEELTLYVLALKKENDKQQLMIDALTKK